MFTAIAFLAGILVGMVFAANALGLNDDDSDF